MEENYLCSQDPEAAFGSGEARFGPELDGLKPWRRQVFGAKMREKNGRKLSAFGTESATRGGSFWTRIRWRKAVAVPGVRGQDAREKWKKTIFVFKDPEAAFGTESATRGGSFWTELDGVKPWRCQVFGARMREKNGRKLFLFLRIQKRRLAPKVRPGEARFGPELDGEKQVFGARMREKK